MPYSSQGQWISGDEGGGTVTPSNYKQVGMNLVYDAPGTQFDGQRVPNNLNMKMTKDGSWMPIMPSAAWDGQGITPTSFDPNFGSVDQYGNAVSGVAPNIQDYIDQYQYGYAKKYGDLLNRPWNTDASTTNDANDILSRYNAAAQANGMHPLNISQLPVTDYAASLPAEQKGSSSMLGGALSDPAVLGMGAFAGGTLLAGLGGGAAAGAGGGAFDFASADALGLSQMGEAAGLSGQALSDFVASGGAASLGGGASAAGGTFGGINPGFTPNVPDIPGVTSGDWLANTGGDLVNNLSQYASQGASGVLPSLGVNGADLSGLGSFGDAFTGAGAGINVPPGSTTALQKLLSGNATASDYAQLAGTLGSSVLGYLGAEKQAGALSDNASKYLALGQPYRGMLAQSYAPGFSMSNEPGYQDAIDQSMNSYLRKASTNGNPFDNPGVSTEALKYVTAGTALPQLNTYRSQLGSFGQLGLNTAGTNDTAAAGASSGTYDALGYGLSQLTQPKQNTDLSSLLQQYLKLNTGSGLT